MRGDEGLIIACLIFLSFFSIATILYFKFSKTKNPIWHGVIFGIIHLIIVIVVSAMIYPGIGRDAECGMGFIVLYIIDLPILRALPFLSNAEEIANKFFGGYSYMRAHFYIPVAICGIFGTLQYFLIGTGIGLLRNKLARKKSLAPK